MVPAEFPLVSVVIPAFNDERYIAEAIDSVMTQDYPAVEVIVVDDGSTDRTRSIVGGYGDRVRLLEQPNQGAAAARNKGIQAATGFYVAFLDADDCWAPGKLGIQVRALQQSQYKMAYARFIVWKPGPDGRFADAAAHFTRDRHPETANSVVKNGWIYADLLLDCLVWTSTVVVETSELRRSGLFDLSLRKGQDYDLWLRLSRQIPMLGIDTPLALYRVNSASVTHRLSDESFEYTVVSSAVRRWGEAAPVTGASPAPGTVRRRLRRLLFNHGLAHYSHGNTGIAVQSFGRALGRHGFSFKPFVYLLLACLKHVWHRSPRVTVACKRS